MKNRAFLALFLAAFVSFPGCAGNNGTFIAPATGAKVKVDLSIPVPAQGSARSLFVVAQTNGLRVRVTPQGQSNPLVDASYDVSASSSVCKTAANVRTCSVTFSAYAGTFTFAFQSYNVAPVNGVIPSSAQLLAGGSVVQTIAAGDTTIGVTLDGAPASIATATHASVVIGGTPSNFSFGVSVHDAANNAIVGAYSSPVTASVTDSGGHTKLSIDGGATRSASVSLASSEDATRLTAYFDGGGSAGYTATVSFSASGAAAASAIVNRFTVTGSALFGTPSFHEASPATAAFSAPAQQLKLTASEPGFTGSFSVTGNTCGSIAANVSAAPAFTLVTQSFGSCALTISDGTNAVPINVGVTVTHSGITPPSGTVHEYSNPLSGLIPAALTTGSDGNIWAVGYTASTGYITKIVPATGAMTNYPLPHDNPVAIASGSDGNLWVLDATANVITVVNMSGNAIASHTTGALPFSITLGSEGAMWLTNSNDDTVTCYPVGGAAATYAIPSSGALTGIAAGTDGALWVGDFIAPHVSRVTAGCATPSGGSVTQFASPFPAGVGGIVAGPDNAVWFTETIASTVGRMSTSGSYSDVGTLAESPDVSIIKGPDLNLWYSGCSCVGSIVRVTPSGSVTPFTSGITATSLVGVAAGSDGGIWYAGDNAGGTAIIGRFQP